MTPQAPLSVLLPPGMPLRAVASPQKPARLYKRGQHIRHIPVEWTPEQEHQRYLARLKSDVVSKGGRLPEPAPLQVLKDDTDPLPDSWWGWVQKSATTVMRGLARYDAAAEARKTPRLSMAQLAEAAQGQFQVEPLKGVKASDSLAGCVVLIATEAADHPRMQAAVRRLLDSVVVSGDTCLLPIAEPSPDVQRLCPSAQAKAADLCHGIDLAFGLGADADLVRLRQAAWDLLQPLAMGLELPAPRNDLLDAQADEAALRHIEMLLEVAQSHWAQGSAQQRQALDLAQDRVIRFLDAWQAMDQERTAGNGLQARHAHMHEQISQHRPSRYHTTYVVLPGEHVDRLQEPLVGDERFKVVMVRPTVGLVPSPDQLAAHARALKDEATAALARQRERIEQRIQAHGVPLPTILVDG
ncbi:hypothetical protein [uncultured Hydrogenophaga sp.]|uniref:hypothetical protein n=1 Tax=uncultured Hydrogenophaga sp. TaxID=199683 RepID=UPI00265F2E72|nr:hypothetical protein [uncultured Hydrogenophaga sp.]